jgi:hypothetical protein
MQQSALVAAAVASAQQAAAASASQAMSESQGRSTPVQSAGTAGQGPPVTQRMSSLTLENQTMGSSAATASSSPLAAMDTSSR